MSNIFTEFKDPNGNALLPRGIPFRKILGSSDDCNALTQEKDTGLYIIASGVSNAAYAWGGLINISAGVHGTHQIEFSATAAGTALFYVRSYTGTPLQWTNWVRIQ